MIPDNFSIQPCSVSSTLRVSQSVSQGERERVRSTKQTKRRKDKETEWGKLSWGRGKPTPPKIRTGRTATATATQTTDTTRAAPLSSKPKKLLCACSYPLHERTLNIDFVAFNYKWESVAHSYWRRQEGRRRPLRGGRETWKRPWLGSRIGLRGCLWRAVSA